MGLLLALLSAAGPDGGFDAYAYRLAVNEAEVRLDAGPSAGNGSPPAAGHGPAVTVSAPAQSIFAGLNRVDRLAAAISVDLKGVQAGVQLTPWNGVGVQLASLEGGAARVGLTWAHEWKTEPRTYGDLTDEGGKSLAATLDRDAIIERIALLAPQLRRLCAALPAWPKLAGELPDAGVAELARDWCDAPDAAATFTDAKKAFIVTVRRYEDALKNATGRERDLARIALAASREDRAALEVKHDDFYTLASDDAVDAALQRWWARHPIITFGASFTADWFPLVWGFEPDCIGEESTAACNRSAGALLTPMRLEPTAAFSLTYGRLKASLGGGVPFSRDDRGAGFRGAPAVKLAVDVVAYDGDLKSEPRIVLGLESQVVLAIDRPKSQEKVVDRFLFAPHVDILINDSLSFRLAVPLRAEHAELDADGDGTADRRDLQWSVPLTIATVLRLD